MSQAPYSQFREDEMILRDHLATDRTILANERTFLAYVRTALALELGGVAIIKWFADSSGLLWGIGAALMVLGGVSIVAGVGRFIKFHRSLRQLRRDQKKPH